MQTIRVKTSRLGRRFEMRRRKNFGWEWLEWQNKSSSTYDHTTIDLNSGRVEDHYNTSEWSEITFQRDENDFSNIGTIKTFEALYRFFRGLRRIATWIFGLAVIATFAWMIFFDTGDTYNMLIEVVGYSLVALVVTFIIQTVFYYSGKVAVHKGRY